MEDKTTLEHELQAIRRILESAFPTHLANLDSTIPAYVWDGMRGGLLPVPKPGVTSLESLAGIDAQKKAVLRNTARFAEGKTANNILLWGAKGMGKSTLLKSAALKYAVASSGRLMVVETLREELATLPRLFSLLRAFDRRFIVFCDDLAFERGDSCYRSLKVAMDGGIGGRARNILFYATSNHRNIIHAATDGGTDSGTALTDTLNDRLALADRFGLSLGFHDPDQDLYLEIVKLYAIERGMNIPEEELRRGAIVWALEKASRSGRTAMNYIDSLG